MRLTSTQALTPAAIVALLVALLPFTAAPTENAYLHVVFPTTNLLLSVTALMLAIRILLRHTGAPAMPSGRLAATVIKALLCITMIIAGTLALDAIISFLVVNAVTLAPLPVPGG